MKTFVTHSGNFHSDDVFACATLALYFEKEGESWEVVRTRDVEKIEKGDVVFDVGGIYDESSDRFDHHQKGGAGERENGVPYASFGIVWKKYGKKLVEDEQIVQYIDEKICQPIDAIDNGCDISKSTIEGVYPYTFQSILSSYRPTWKEDTDEDEIFLTLVTIAKDILQREIIHIADGIEARTKIEKVYEESEDKKIIVFDEVFTRDVLLLTLVQYEEPVYFVYQKRGGHWKVETVRKSMDSFEARKDLPEEWAGLRDEALAEVTGVSDAYFCHNGRFLAVAVSREGAVELAQKALNS